MKTTLAYGKTGLPLELPDAWDVTLIEPQFMPGLPDPGFTLRQALAAPLASLPLESLVAPTDKVGIVFSDLTRPTPNALILPAIIEALADLPSQNITLFNGLGTHRPNTDAELRSMLGDDLVDRFCIVQNNAFDPATLVYIGQSSQEHPVWLNRELFECDLKVLTGFIEPHMFAGYSGGGKALMPGMAGAPTIFANHSAPMLAHPAATWGVAHGNPVWEEIRQIAQMAGRLFLVNVTLNKHKQVTGVFAGDLDAAFEAGSAFTAQTAMLPVEKPFDIVITTNSGYPLDLNLYQSVKGMSAAAQVVRPGGAIIIATDCWDGIPEYGLYSEFLRAVDNPQALLDLVSIPGPTRQDQWQAQIHAQVQLKADIYIYTQHLTDEQVRSALLTPCHDIPATLCELLDKYGSHARICILPEGPQTILYLSN
jgi:nickel-dependent lactate racemase